MTLETLIKLHWPKFHQIMSDTNQISEICLNILKTMGAIYFGKYPWGLTLIDNYLVGGWRGFYERLIIILYHLEFYIENSDDGILTLRIDKSFSREEQGMPKNFWF